LAMLAAIRPRLGQGQVTPELLQMRGHDCPSKGLRRETFVARLNSFRSVGL
jgi:hypothetical protein